jgi:hypothetical protein
MSVVDRIIAQVDAGKPYKQIADAYPWHSIGVAEKQRLFAEATNRNTSVAKPTTLLYTLYVMAENANELWDSARALALILRRPDFRPADKQRGFDELRKKLDQIRSTLSTQDPASVSRYKLYEADYLALKAEALESSSPDKALDCYREARAIWQKYGEGDKTKLADDMIALLENIIRNQQSLLPLELLTSERMKLQEEIATLQADVGSTKQELSSLKQQAQRLKDDTERLKREAQTKLAYIETLRSQEEQGSSRLRGISSQITQSEAALQFLLALPRAATAPLWLEVLKLALAQGNMDPLALQAMERLSIQCPEEGLPVLAEIIARLPDGHGVDPIVFQRVSTDWVVGMSRAMVRVEGDPEGAARELIEAWSGFFGEGKQEVESAG